MNILRRCRYVCEQCVARHAIIALGMIVRHEAFVAPEPVRALPRELRCNIPLPKPFIKALRGRTAGAANGEAACRGARLHTQPLRSFPCQHLGIAEHPQFAAHDTMAPSCSASPLFARGCVMSR